MGAVENLLFLERLAKAAVEDMKRSGVLASVTIVQGILESGWGTSELAVNALNFFGMKKSLSGNTWEGSTWDGVSVYTKQTGEQNPDGTRYTITADFRKYKSLEESVADHSAYLTGAMNGKKKRYEGLVGEKDVEKALTIIKNGGYATSVDYVSNLMRIVKTYNLTQYDNIQEGSKEMAKVKIMLDAGHAGKYNRSPGVPAYYESDFTFKFVNMLIKELQQYGIEAGRTRESQDKDLDLTARGKAAKGCNLFISVHSNAVGSGVNNSVDYPVAITMVQDNKTTIDEESKAVGEKLAAVVAKVMGTNQAGRTYTKLSANDRDGNGIFDDEYYGVLHGAKLVKVPGIIIEHSFHTCNAAATWLLNDDNLRRLAAAEAATLADHYGMKKGTPGTEDQEEQKQQAVQEANTATWYRVRKSWKDVQSQLGAYRIKDNALKNCPEGYSVFDNDGNVIYSNNAAKATWYRVRKSWGDAASQVGAYKVYDNAVNSCPAGYAVYDDNGNVLYRNVSQHEYTVVAGDTLGKIARDFGTTVEAIVEANKGRYPRITPSYIVTGWKLVIK